MDEADEQALRLMDSFISIFASTGRLIWEKTDGDEIIDLPVAIPQELATYFQELREMGKSSELIPMMFKLILIKGVDSLLKERFAKNVAEGPMGEFIKAEKF